MKKILIRCVSAAVVASATFLGGAGMTVSAQETSSRLENYLRLDNLVFGLPYLRENADINQNKFSTQTLFSYPFFDRELDYRARPAAGEKFSWQGEEKMWEKVNASLPVTESEISALDSNHYAWVLNCFYLQVDRYAELSAELSYAPAYELYMDGVKVLSRTSEADTMQPKAQQVSLTAEPGYHIFMMKALYTPSTKPWGGLEFSLKADSGVIFSLGADVSESYGLMHYIDAPVLSSPQLSFKGEYLALKCTAPDPKVKKNKTTYSIYRTADFAKSDALPQACMELRGISNLQFSTKAPCYAYMQKSGAMQQIFVGEWDAKGLHPARLVYRTKDDISGFYWDPQGRYLLLSVSQNASEPANGLKHIYDPQDHWSYYRSRQNLARLDVKSGVRTPLTYGYRSTGLLDISQDGRQILFYTSEMADSVRPYSLQKVYRMNMETLAADFLFETYSSVQAVFSPRADKLLVLGPEQTFKDFREPGLGFPCENEDCFIPNDFDIDAFVYDMKTGKATLLTEDFGPSVEQALWDGTGRYIYARVEQADAQTLYFYDMAAKKWSPLPLQAEVLSGFDLCAEALAYTGSSIDRPYQAFFLKGDASKADFARNFAKTVKVAGPQDAQLKNVRIGAHEEWGYVTSAGDSIEALFYLPPDFDASKKYPCIVYYYGGTSPTPRALSMRYPKSVWASAGYVVLVVQPSGATGYSREFSARHVNNWGKTVADEIIEGTQKFYRTHPYVDSTKLGCIGASYGGFMTQLLVTRTDMFAAAVSHAGISALSSYWGEGYWGYAYCAIANAFSFPWNRRDLFVDQSPLFNADKIHTPLLLLHGTSDVNVPIGESWQMYKALRLLGREVAMVTVSGEDHVIGDYAKRIEWEKTILAWFAKHLKDQPEWWNALYPQRKL